MVIVAFLGPLLFILYTTLLSKVISDSSSSHKLYADDTELYIAILAADLALLILSKLYLTSIIGCHLSFLSLNPSKAEFLVIGPPKQLEKLNILLFIYL